VWAEQNCIRMPHWSFLKATTGTGAMPASATISVTSCAYHLNVTPSPVVRKGYSGALCWVPKGLLCQNLDFWHVKHGEKVLCLGGKSVSLRWRLAKTHVATFRGRTATNLAF